MNGQAQLDAAIYAASLEHDIRSRGYEIVVDNNFEEFTKTCNDPILGKPGISPPLNATYVDIDPLDMIWIQASFGDEIVAVEGMHHECISIPLSRHVHRKYHRIFKDGHGRDASFSGQAPGASQLSGRLVYHGDLFIKENHRKGGLATKLARLIITLAVLKWNPDYVWGYIAEKLVRTGYGLDIGYPHVHQDGLHWEGEPPTGRSISDCFVWSTREDLSYMFACEADQIRKEQAERQNVSSMAKEVGRIAVR